MKEKNLKSNKGLQHDTALVPVYVKGPANPKGYEIEKIEITMKKTIVVNPNPLTLKKAAPAVKKPIAKPVAKKVVAKKAVAKKVVAKKTVAPKKVVKKK